MRELMCSHIEQRRQDREHESYLRRKAAAGCASMRAGRGRPNDKVEAIFAAKRNRVSPGRP